MQNRYTGDVGDFGKYGILKMVSSGPSLRLGINWYLTDDESHNKDGKHIGYLDDTKRKNTLEFRACDPTLYKQLQDVVINGRTIRSIQDSHILPEGTVFYDQVLSYNAEVDTAARKKERERWYRAGFKQLETCEIVFFDPDNGLEVESVGKYSDKGPKYVWHDEVIDYYQRGQSLIIYNHRSREPQEKYLKRFDRIRAITPEPNNVVVLRYSRGTTRDYVFLMQSSHRGQMMKNIEALMNSPWNRHFSLVMM